MTRTALRLPAALIIARLAAAWRASKAPASWQAPGDLQPQVSSR